MSRTGFGGKHTVSYAPYCMCVSVNVSHDLKHFITLAVAVENAVRESQDTHELHNSYLSSPMELSLQEGSLACRGHVR